MAEGMPSRQSPKETGAREGELTMSQVLIVQVTPEIPRHRGWFQAFGIVLLVLGIAAIVRSQETEETSWEV
jgi:hypothetical protein